VRVLTNSDWSRGAPLIIAHRGASAYAPENTLAAFRLAGEMGADAIELDAKLTADGQIVVHHDGMLDRTTTGSGRLSEHTLAQIRQLDAGRKYDVRFSGERVPTLEEVLAEIGQQLLINVELKDYERPRDDLPQAAAALVRSMGLQARVLFSSFNPLALRRARRQAPEIPTALLVTASDSRAKRALYRMISSPWACHPEERMVDAKLIDDEHRRGRRVNVWTVNNAARIAALFAGGVDGVITAMPDLAYGLRNEGRRRA
jgi:glycerophosphoryl diester phosphodiesterase